MRRHIVGKVYDVTAGSINSLIQQLEESQEEVAELNALLAGNKHPFHETLALLEALEKIHDKRKRDHQEPDSQTEVYCMNHIAGEALTAYLTSHGVKSLQELKDKVGK